MNAFAFEAGEEVFSNSVVIGGTLAGHALAQTEIGEARLIHTGSILDAAVGVEDERLRWTATSGAARVRFVSVRSEKT